MSVLSFSSLRYSDLTQESVTAAGNCFVTLLIVETVNMVWNNAPFVVFIWHQWTNWGRNAGKWHFPSDFGGETVFPKPGWWCPLVFNARGCIPFVAVIWHTETGFTLLLLALLLREHVPWCSKTYRFETNPKIVLGRAPFHFVQFYNLTTVWHSTQKCRYVDANAVEVSKLSRFMSAEPVSDEPKHKLNVLCVIITD